eukprot:TRINITY_DN193_c1_g1_i1.p1 TRINITY_DN193_c1_g1~~TRINITY_DN193_c1_g1_i1.p1  ORF type:complete len:964 (-),score=246.89 TRINITY_DN193_c1_g1_i1:2508-5006(-)
MSHGIAQSLLALVHSLQDKRITHKHMISSLILLCTHLIIDTSHRSCQTCMSNCSAQKNRLVSRFPEQLPNFQQQPSPSLPTSTSNFRPPSSLAGGPINRSISPSFGMSTGQTFGNISLSPSPTNFPFASPLSNFNTMSPPLTGNSSANLMGGDMGIDGLGFSQYSQQQQQQQQQDKNSGDRLGSWITGELQKLYKLNSIEVMKIQRQFLQHLMKEGYSSTCKLASKSRFGQSQQQQQQQQQQQNKRLSSASQNISSAKISKAISDLSLHFESTLFLLDLDEVTQAQTGDSPLTCQWTPENCTPFEDSCATFDSYFNSVVQIQQQIRSPTPLSPIPPLMSDTSDPLSSVFGAYQHSQSSHSQTLSPATNTMQPTCDPSQMSIGRQQQQQHLALQHSSSLLGSFPPSGVGGTMDSPFTSLNSPPMCSLQPPAHSDLLAAIEVLVPLTLHVLLADLTPREQQQCLAIVLMARFFACDPLPISPSSSPEFGNFGGIEEAARSHLGRHMRAKCKDLAVNFLSALISKRLESFADYILVNKFFELQAIHGHKSLIRELDVHVWSRSTSENTKEVATVILDYLIGKSWLTVSPKGKTPSEHDSFKTVRDRFKDLSMSLGLMNRGGIGFNASNKQRLSSSGIAFGNFQHQQPSFTTGTTSSNLSSIFNRLHRPDFSLIFKEFCPQIINKDDKDQDINISRINDDDENNENTVGMDNIQQCADESLSILFTCLRRLWPLRTAADCLPSHSAADLLKYIQLLFGSSSMCSSHRDLIRQELDFLPVNNRIIHLKKGCTSININPWLCLEHIGSSAFVPEISNQLPESGVYGSQSFGDYELYRC